MTGLHGALQVRSTASWQDSKCRATPLAPPQLGFSLDCTVAVSSSAPKAGALA